MAKTHKWRAIPAVLFGAFFDPLVVVTAMTAASLIVAVLALAGSGIVSKKVLAVCIGIAIVGLITIFHQMRRLYRFDMARTLINELIVEGTEITLRVDDKVIQGETKIREWTEKAEGTLRKYLGEGYVKRFHLGGSNTQDATSMTVWKTNHRLETLATFLKELK